MKIETRLSRKIVLGLIFGMVATVVVGLVAYRSTVLFAESAQIVHRTHETLSDLQELLYDTASAEGIARGYLLYGNDQVLDQYRTAVKEVVAGFEALRNRDLDPASRERLEVLDQLTHDRLDRLEVLMEMRTFEGLNSVIESRGPGKRLMSDLRVVAAEIQTRQNNLLQERGQYSKSLARRTTVFVILGSLLAVLVVTVSVAALVAGVARRERLEREVVEISEREQRRIGQDLHDGVCQELTGIALLSRGLEQRLAGQPAADAAQITRLINRSIDQARRVTRGLHPVPDEPTGMLLALKEFAESVQATTKVPCQFVCPEPVPIADPVAATNVYRIAQEAVQNALRHAKPGMIMLELRFIGENIVLTVRDDGIGIPVQRSGPGLGIEIMKHRAQSIGARIEMHRGETSGTVVTCVLPRG